MALGRCVTVVALEVAGSNPVIHPNYYNKLAARSSRPLEADKLWGGTGWQNPCTPQDLCGEQQVTSRRTALAHSV